MQHRGALVKILLPALALLVLALGACSTEDYRNTMAERTAVAEQRVEEARVPSALRRYNPLTVTDSIWAGGKAVRMRHGLPLPERVEGLRGVAVISPVGMSMRAIANMIAMQTGIPVRLGKDADMGSDEDSPAAPAASAKKSAASSPSSSSSAKKDAAPASFSSGKGGSPTGMRIAYEGPLSGLLDRVASHFGTSWKYNGTAITISKYDTRVFVMDALPGTQKVKDGMKEDTGAQASSGGGNVQVTNVSQSAADQSSTMDIDFKFWDEVGKTLETILAGDGSYALSPSSGTVTVVTTPETMQQVADYLNQENERLARQVAINVEIYTVDINEGEDFNMKFDTALKRLADVGANFTSAGSPGGGAASGLGSLAIAILNPNTTGQITSMFNLLNSVGNTVRVAQFPMTTLNNRPVARRIGRDRTYLASVQTNTSQTFQNTTLTPGIIRDGFSIQVTPRILGDGRILLQYSLSLIDLLDITSFTSGNNQIQLPQTASRVFVQQSMLRSGSTLVLAGYDQDQVQQNSQGVGNAYNYLLGGGVVNRKVRQVLFIAMTPQEISLPRTENE